MNNTSIWFDIQQIFKRNDNSIYQIILINVLIFIAVNVLKLFVFLFGTSGIYYEIILKYLAVPVDIHQLIFRPWTIISYMFLHEGFMHILFNMLWLYWIGSILREYIGNQKILPVYLLGGIFGATLYILSYNVFPVFQNVIGSAYALGASAGVLAIVVATATLLPDYTIHLLFFGAVRLKYLAIAGITLDLTSIPGGNAGGHIAHLGGALFGFIFIKQLNRGNDWSKPVNYLFDFVSDIFKSKSKQKIVHSQTFPAPKKEKDIDSVKQTRINVTLDKIAQSGYESLTTEEKEFLFKASKDNN